jgi:hypothetical protein
MCNERLHKLAGCFVRQSAAQFADTHNLYAAPHSAAAMLT